MYSLGPFQIPQAFVLAPMAGITNSPFRRLLKRYGSGLVISELVSANGMLYGNDKTFDLLKFHSEERPVGLQIFGETAESLAEASRIIEELGADFVDLNLGCPVPKVVRKGGGSAMCRDLPKLYRVLSEMKSAIQIPLSIKVRTGWDSENINIHEVVQVAADAGVCWVAIHGRTRAQQYSGLADWDLIGEVKAKSKIPIIGNGDIQTPEQAVHAYQHYGVDAVMIGRAALRNPFIFRQAGGLLRGEGLLVVSASEFLDFLFQQRDLLKETEHERIALIQSKKFLAWYSAGYVGCHDFRKRIFQLNSFDEVWSFGQDFFAPRLENRDMSFMNEAFLMGGHG